jgi:hypothetical protein
MTEPGVSGVNQQKGGDGMDCDLDGLKSLIRNHPYPNIRTRSGASG